MVGSAPSSPAPSFPQKSAHGVGTPAPRVIARDLHKTFRRSSGETVQALDGISLQVADGALTALVGPDGAGKTTLLRLMCGLMLPDEGDLQVLGLDVRHQAAEIQTRIGYMPQKFGLYEDLTVQENLDLYADLHGVTAQQRRTVYPRLLEMTDLGRFTGRLAGKLSGGMKQKLGLACTLVRTPDLLLLDEPTVGVDPVSRRDLWDIVLTLVHDHGLSVLVATSYLDEAERSDHAVVLHQGRILTEGPPQAVADEAKNRSFVVRTALDVPSRRLQRHIYTQAGVIDAVPQAGQVRVVLDGPERAGALGQDDGLRQYDVSVTPVPPRFEDGFMQRLHAASDDAQNADLVMDRPVAGTSDETVIEVSDLVRTFGDFTAVDHMTFSVRRGEIFGLLGSNGAGKSTTFRMLCGLMPATSGSLRVAGADLRTSRAEARKKLGYVAQKFSLYGQISVDENLTFFASVYGLRGQRKRQRIAWAKEQFGLGPFSRLPSGQLPGGFKQRLAMAVALLHEPDILFLDEATSGADPLARREFWGRIGALSEQGVTVVVTTHFMEEAEYCDRIVIMDSGRSLAEGTPSQIRARAAETLHQEAASITMDDAFISIIDQGRQPSTVGGDAE